MHSHETLPPLTTLGPYTIQEWVGSGAFGTVYRGTESGNAMKEVALKVAHPAVVDNPDSMKRFLGEAEITRKLSHPHIVPVHR